MDALIIQMIICGFLLSVNLPIMIWSMYWQLKYKDQAFLRVRGIHNRLVHTVLAGLLSVILVPGTFLYEYLHVYSNNSAQIKDYNSYDLPHTIILISFTSFSSAFIITALFQRGHHFGKFKIASKLCGLYHK